MIDGTLQPAFLPCLSDPPQVGTILSLQEGPSLPALPLPTVSWSLLPYRDPLLAQRREAASQRLVHPLSPHTGSTTAAFNSLDKNLPRLRPFPTEHPHLSSLILKYQMQSYLRAQEAFTGGRAEDGSSEGAKVVPFTLP